MRKLWISAVSACVGVVVGGASVEAISAWNRGVRTQRTLRDDGEFARAFADALAHNSVGMLQIDCDKPHRRTIVDLRSVPDALRSSIADLFLVAPCGKSYDDLRDGPS